MKNGKKTEKKRKFKKKLKFEKRIRPFPFFEICVFFPAIFRQFSGNFPAICFVFFAFLKNAIRFFCGGIFWDFLKTDSGFCAFFQFFFQKHEIVLKKAAGCRSGFNPHRDFPDFVRF